jgi:hypothetical protein
MNYLRKQAESGEKRGKNPNEFHGEAAATSIHNAGAAYDNASLIASGAAPQNIAWLSVGSNLLLSFLCIKAPLYLTRLGTLKRAALILSLLSALVWFPLIWLFLTGAATPINLIPLFILSALPVAILAPVRDSWLAGLIPGQNMGRYYGIRSVFTSLAYLVTFYAMGYLLDMFGTNTLAGFAIIFITASFAMFVNIILYQKAPVPVPEVDDGFDFQDFLGEAKLGNMGTFILFLSLFAIGVNLASPFFSVYMLRDLKLGYLEYTVILSTEYLARIGAALCWGRYADKAGSLKVLRICSYVIPLVPIIWIFARTPLQLILLHIFSGTVWAGFDLGSATYIYRSAPGPRRLKYILYQKSLTTLATATGNLLGTFLLSIIAPVFGNPILTLFLLSGLVRFLAVRSIFPKLVDLTIPEKTVVPVLRPVRTPSALPCGFYYRPNEWVRAKESPGAYKITAENLFPATTLFRPALYNLPERWHDYATGWIESKAKRFRLEKIGIPEYPGVSGR